MEEMVKHAAGIVFVGIGATAVLDIWIFALKALGVPTLNFALLGRWVGHMACGKWRHERIGNARPVRGELLWGWIAHYAIGIAFAALLVLMNGTGWLAAPSLLPALLTGFALALARGVGEYGSVIFIAGNMPFRSEIAPLLIVTQLEQYSYAGATGIAAVMLVISFLLLLFINLHQAWSRRRSLA